MTLSPVSLKPMTRATRKAGTNYCTVVVLDSTWLRMLPGVRRVVRTAGRAATRRPLTVALANDKLLRSLNKRDRKKDKPTNVLAYPSAVRGHLGDVVLARETVWREAKKQKKRPADHVAHLVVHGVLHLLGHNHETSEKAAERMEALERHILNRLGIDDPYEVH